MAQLAWINTIDQKAVVIEAIQKSCYFIDCAQGRRNKFDLIGDQEQIKAMVLANGWTTVPKRKIATRLIQRGLEIILRNRTLLFLTTLLTVVKEMHELLTTCAIPEPVRIQLMSHPDELGSQNN
eukprot:139396_1